MTAEEMKFESVLLVEDIKSGGYTGFITGMPGVCGQGATIQETLRSVANGLDVYFEMKEENKQP